MVEVGEFLRRHRRELVDSASERLLGLAVVLDDRVNVSEEDPKALLTVELNGGCILELTDVLLPDGRIVVVVELVLPTEESFEVLIDLCCGACGQHSCGGFLEHFR